MNKVILILFFQIFYTSLFSQYYIRGQIKDEKGNTLQNVSIVVHSSDQIFKSGQEGRFGITSNKLNDTLIFSTEGYEGISKPVNANEYQQIILKALPKDLTVKKNYLKSFNRNIRNEVENNWTVEDETYNSLVENDFAKTKSSPLAVFSANINRASYSNIRRFLNNDYKVPPDAVRIEEMLNYFNFSYTEPPEDQTFAIKSYLSSCPWKKDHQLLFLNISAKKIKLDKVPPSNLVLLIDVSGSMFFPNKLPLLKSGFRLLVKNLRSIDTISIVAYGESTSIVLEGASGNEKDKIFKAIELLSPRGPTPGEAGIKLAYQVAKRRLIKGGNNRIILASDGDFNVGKSSEKELEDLIEQQKKSGIYLTCLGVGMGNYKDSKLSMLAGKGKGNFAYIDNEQEAEKVLVTGLTQTLFSVADNVAISVKFDSSFVKEYRLIGFDNSRVSLKDTSSKLLGGEIGSGYSMIALFELAMEGAENENKKELARVKINYYQPADSSKKEISYTCIQDFVPLVEADSSLRKAADIAMFGMKLRASKYASQIKWKQLESMAKKDFSPGVSYEKEYIDLVVKARKIYSKRRRKE